MKVVNLIVAVLILASSGVIAQTPKEQTLRGWISDEQCVRGRASSGVYTGTNPTCAKECVAKGKKIAFVDPTGKRVLSIANQVIAKNNIGDEVEITGTLDPQAKTLRVTSLKMLEKGAAMCARPQKGE